MVFDITKSPNEKIELFYNQSMEKLKDFYGINWCKSTPKLMIVSDRKTYDLLKGEKTELWMVGTTLGSSHSVYLLSPDVYDTDSNHEYSDEYFSRLICHELSHLFTRILYKEYIPVWLLEGIAIYSSDQLQEKEKPKEFKSFLSYFYNGGSGVYSESGFAVEILVNEFGKEKLFDFLKCLDKIKVTEESFKELFEEMFDIELEYNWFNKKLNK